MPHYVFELWSTVIQYLTGYRLLINVLMGWVVKGFLCQLISVKYNPKTHSIHSGVASGGFLLPVPGKGGQWGQLPVPAGAGASLQSGATWHIHRPLYPHPFCHAVFHTWFPAGHSLKQTHFLPLQQPGKDSASVVNSSGMHIVFKKYGCRYGCEQKKSP